MSINKSRVTLNEILNDIESQTDYLFVYNNQVDVSRKVSVKVKNKPVNQILYGIFGNTDTDFVIEGTHIMLTRNKVNEVSSVTQAGRTVTQTGRTVTVIVSDAMGEVIGANVVVKGTTNGNITDMNGKVVLQNVPKVFEGAVAGLQVCAVDGQPGKDMAIRVRGLGSTNIGSSSALIVIDGVPRIADGTTQPLSTLNPADICFPMLRMDSAIWRQLGM